MQVQDCDSGLVMSLVKGIHTFSRWDFRVERAMKGVSFSSQGNPDVDVRKVGIKVEIRQV
jgi:hypothetical protein